MQIKTRQSHVCAPGRTRTYDRQIRRLLLYPLSYGGRSTPFIEIDAGSRITVAPELSSRSNVQCDATSHGGPYASPIPRSDRCCFRLAPSGTRFFMAADSEDFELFLLQRQAAAGEYVSGNPEPLGRLVAQELPATFFSPRGDVTTGTHDVWARYGGTPSCLPAAVKTHSSLSTRRPAVTSRTGSVSSGPRRTCAARTGR
jgi:hypothetical protein